MSIGLIKIPIAATEGKNFVAATPASLSATEIQVVHCGHI